MNANKKAALSPVKTPNGKRMKSSTCSENMADTISAALTKQQDSAYCDERCDTLHTVFNCGISITDDHRAQAYRQGGLFPERDESPETRC